MTRFAGRRVLAWGLGRHGGGAAVVRYLHRCGASVAVVDAATEQQLLGSLQSLDEIRNEIDFHFDAGPHAFSPDEFDTLVVNPAIPVDHPELARWQCASSCTATSELAILLDEIGSRPVVAVTGSNGKSTVALWTANLLKRVTPTRPVLLGGNFEPGLVDEYQLHLLDLAPFDADAVIVLELSSFQLSHLRDRRVKPTVAVLTSLSPNHLDWHRSFDEYKAAKYSLFDGAVKTIDWSRERDSASADAYAILGQSVDRSNAVLVERIVNAMGHECAAADVIAARPRIPHRRTLVADHDGVSFIDDSAATTPESVEELLREYGHETRSSLVVIAGGRNKGFSINQFAKMLSKRCSAVATIGECGSELASRVAVHGCKVRSHRSLQQAVRWAKKIVPNGGVVALSPGMASTDQFQDYRDRGMSFRRILQETIARNADSRDMRDA